MTSLAQLLVDRREDGRLGLLELETGRRWSWAEVVAASAVRGAWLASERREGPWHVGVLLDDVAEFPLLLGAAALQGVTIVGLNPTRGPAELARDVAHTDVQLVVTERRHVGALGQVGLDPDRIVLVDDDRWVPRLAPFVGSSSPALLPGDDALALLLFTSGTTADPKAVRTTQGRLARQCQVLVEMLGLTAQDVTYTAMPLFHSNALTAGWAPTLAAGGTLALRRRFSASTFIADVRECGATYTHYVGKPLAYVLAQPPQADDGDVPLRIVFGNEASDRDLHAFAERFGCTVIDGYGSTEGGVALARSSDAPRGAIGRTRSGLDVLHVDTGRPCPDARFDGAGQLVNADEAIGELVGTGGPGAFEGYWRNPDAEAERVRDGRFHTGDLVYRDADGWLYFAGRRDGWVRVDGENLAIAPIAAALSDHDEVVEAAVVAVPDPQVGDQLLAVVVPRPGAGSRGELAATLRAYLRGRPDLGAKSVPRFLRLVDELPRTVTHKVRGRDLADAGWWSTEDVLWRPPGDDEAFVPLTAVDRDAMLATLQASGRYVAADARHPDAV
ncbi:AMP-binding protein [Nitriliruptor alkaliphilus]|uniref:AMP-binding protein n=1 Tax=Nitriliruptor alkaliphilus TaxID=427918 RepID=UPI0009FA7FAA|nr:AMP-binding protein [Nitriliruptor alkaliphilus]